MDEWRTNRSMDDTHISLAHGNGGHYMRELIEELFARHLANPLLDTVQWMRRALPRWTAK